MSVTKGYASLALVFSLQIQALYEQSARTLVSGITWTVHQDSTCAFT